MSLKTSQPANKTLLTKLFIMASLIRIKKRGAISLLFWFYFIITPITRKTEYHFLDYSQLPNTVHSSFGMWVIFFRPTGTHFILQNSFCLFIPSESCYTFFNFYVVNFSIFPFVSRGNIFTPRLLFTLPPFSFLPYSFISAFSGIYWVQKAWRWDPYHAFILL